MATSYPASGPVTLRTNLADSVLSKPLKSGAITSSLVTFDFCGPKVAHDGFKPMVRDGAYDAGELAIVTYLQARQYNKPLILLPAVVVGRFQHHCIGYNAEKGTLGPKDIEGKRAGIRSYTQTTGVWVRGILQHEYGVDLNRVTWACMDDAHLAEYNDPPNVERLPKGGKSIPQMLLDGDIDAAILGNDMPKDPCIKTLIPDPQQAGQEWQKKYGTVPINHMFVVSAALSKERPDVVREVYRMLEESRKAADLTEANRQALRFGIASNRKAIELVIAYALEQKIVTRRFAVDELFDDVTRTLAN
jgi:4,5-dihydroxyphthalate decarboxylase